jgi:hypothetical protein
LNMVDVLTPARSRSFIILIVTLLNLKLLTNNLYTFSLIKMKQTYHPLPLGQFESPDIPQVGQITGLLHVIDFFKDSFHFLCCC